MPASFRTIVSNDRDRCYISTQFLTSLCRLLVPIYAGSYTLTYQDKVYEINETQENTFTHCANYNGYENPKSVFLYDYFFVIDEAYIATLPLKK